MKYSCPKGYCNAKFSNKYTANAHEKICYICPICNEVKQNEAHRKKCVGARKLKSKTEWCEYCQKEKTQLQRHLAMVHNITSGNGARKKHQKSSQSTSQSQMQSTSSSQSLSTAQTQTRAATTSQTGETSQPVAIPHDGAGVTSIANFIETFVCTEIDDFSDPEYATGNLFLFVYLLV